MIRIIKGVFGWFDGRRVIPLTEDDGPVSIDHDLEARLVDEGIAEYVGEPATEPAPVEAPKVEPEPVEDEAKDLSGMLKAELVELAEAKGIKVSGLTKAELVEAIKASE